MKGPFVTLEAFRRVHLARPAVTLDWIGACSSGRPMEEWISRHHLEGAVQMHGALRHCDIPPILRKSSVLLQASLTTAGGAVEGWGTSIAEALASGLPAIVSRSGGTVQLVIEGHNGLLFEEGNSSEMADAMLRLEGYLSLRAEMGRKRPAPCRNSRRLVSRSLRHLEDRASECLWDASDGGGAVSSVACANRGSAVISPTDYQLRDYWEDRLEGAFNPRDVGCETASSSIGIATEVLDYGDQHCRRERARLSHTVERLFSGPGILRTGHMSRWLHSTS